MFLLRFGRGPKMGQNKFRQAERSSAEPSGQRADGRRCGPSPSRLLLWLMQKADGRPAGKAGPIDHLLFCQEKMTQKNK